MLGLNEPLHKDKLNDQVFDRLCSLLRQGQFTPGEAVTVASISEAFDVSAMPVREAITRLIAVGALTRVSGRSVGVPKLGLDELEDLRNVRLEVEALAVRWAVRNRNASFLGELQTILGRLIAAENENDSRAFIKENYTFHAKLYRQAASPVLNDIVENLWLRVSPHLYHVKRSDTHRVSNEQHRIIVEAVSNGDADAAIAALTEDITRAYSNLIEALFGAELAS